MPYIVSLYQLLMISNYEILYTISSYCNQKILKNFTLLSKKYHQAAQSLLIHTFYNLIDCNKYHHKINLKCSNIPTSHWHLIVVLDLSYSKLTSLSESIGQLTQLQVLSVHRNQLTSLPDSIGQLTRLQTLDVFCNKLTSLPDSIGQLTLLRTLYVSDNQLTSLPYNIEQMRAAGRLRIA